MFVASDRAISFPRFSLSTQYIRRQTGTNCKKEKKLIRLCFISCMQASLTMILFHYFYLLSAWYRVWSLKLKLNFAASAEPMRRLSIRY